MNERRLDVLDELCTPSMARGWRRWVAPFQASFPDMRMEIVQLVADGDTVVGRFNVLGHAHGRVARSGRDRQAIRERRRGLLLQLRGRADRGGVGARGHARSHATAWPRERFTIILRPPLRWSAGAGSPTDTSQSRRRATHLSGHAGDPERRRATQHRSVTRSDRKSTSQPVAARGPTGRVGRHRPTSGTLALRKSRGLVGWRLLWYPVRGRERLTEAKRRRQGLVVCRAALPFEGL